MPAPAVVRPDGRRAFRFDNHLEVFKHIDVPIRFRFDHRQRHLMAISIRRYEELHVPYAFRFDTPAPEMVINVISVVSLRCSLGM